MRPWSNRPIRVAHVIQNLNYGGMERVLHSLARALPSRGFEVHVVVLQYYGRFAEGLDETATLHQVPPMSRLSLFYPRALAAALRTIEPDIVHSHTGVWLKGSRAGRIAGAHATVHTEHGRPDPVPLTDRLIDNWASRSTDITIAVSEPLAAVLREQVVHDPERIRVIPNGVDTDRTGSPDDRITLRRELDLPEDAMVIGSVGRLEAIKNFGLALEAFSRLKHSSAEGQPWLVIVGDGSQRPALERRAAALGIAARVRFLGWREDAERLYRAFDLFTLSSLSEGTSISLLEAMAREVCPVVTDVGGNRAVLGADLSSLLVPTGEAAGLAERWQLLLQNPEERRRLAGLAKLRVEQGFSLSRAVDRQIEVYHEALGLAADGARGRGSARAKR